MWEITTARRIKKYPCNDDGTTHDTKRNKFLDQAEIMKEGTQIYSA
jgi:hypothetical protein